MNSIKKRSTSKGINENNQILIICLFLAQKIQNLINNFRKEKIFLVKYLIFFIPSEKI